MSLKYQQATFRILVDTVVQVEVSIMGCESDRDAVDPQHVVRGARIIERIARAVRKIQQQLEAESHR